MNPRDEAMVEQLRSALGRKDAVIDDSARLERYAADTYWKALAAQERGEPMGMPDVAVLPQSEEEVAATLAIATELRVPVVPRGGGSGSQGGAVPIHGGILIDLTGLDRIVDVDENSLTVTAEAGVNGRVLEEELNRRGLMLPHYPASAELATVGGYVAARGSGVLSTRYGKIEDLVISLKVATPTGELIETVPVPRHAVGPELTQLYVGSEGALGVITRVTLQLAPLPQLRRFELVSFDSLETGVAAIREAITAGLRPSVVRMYDEEATRTSLGPVVGEELDGICTVLAFEGLRRVADAEAEATLELADSRGARVLDGALAKTWWRRRYDFYDPPHHPQLPAIWGTLEAVATYRRILDVYAALQHAVAERYASDGLQFKAHLSHWYPWGTMIYGRFVIPDGGSDASALHDAIWRDGITSILEAGGVMNDHHGVGIKLAPFMESQHGPALDTLRRIKRALDPDQIMNPGKMAL